tara:strand:+ start:29757 stop:31058 length:1302 start_codon:yes stop_codon:yes gene_type:complete
MMEGWKEIEFGTIASFRNGLNFNKDSHGKGVLIIGVPDFQDYFKPRYDTLGEILPDGILKKEDFLAKGDILFVRSNGNKLLVGRSLFIDKTIEAVFSGFCIRARINNKNALPIFYAYITRTKRFRALLSASSGGTNIQNLNQGILNKVKVPNPPLKTQRKIASILSAYDDLIENNLKRIKLLEEQAQQTYEEWFVRFKFPGYENVEIDEVSGLPVGWEEGRLSDLINFQSGFAYKSAQFIKEGFSVIKIKNIGNNTIDTENTNFINEEYASKTEKFKLNSGDLLIAMTGATVGKVGVVPITQKPCYLNQRVGRFVSFEEVDNSAFINCFFNIGNGLHHVLNIAGGAAQPNISASQILSIETIVPKLEVLKKFSKYAISASKAILNLQNQNQHLKEARDILLPRLMSGMIDVDSLEVGEQLGMVAEEKSEYKKA